MKEKRKNNNIYLSIILIYVVITAIFTAVYYAGIMSPDSLKAFIIALSLNFINAITAYPLMKRGAAGTNQQFLIFSLGGMLLRILFLLMIIFIIIKFMNVNLIEFLIGFFVFYFAFLVWEMYYYAKRTVKKEISK